MLDSYNATLWAFGLILTFLVFAISISSLVFLLRFRNKRIVAMGQPRLLMILCLGSMMIGTSMALYTALYSPADVEESNVVDVVVQSNESDAFLNMDVMCNAGLWFWYMGMVTIMTILFCKLYRVHKVMRFRRRQTILTRQIFGPFVLAQLVGIGILTTAQILFPQTYRPLKKANGEIAAMFCCAGQPEFTFSSLGFLYEILFGYLELLTMGILLFAWKVRHVNEEIGHSRRLFLICFFDTIAIVSGLVVIGVIHTDSVGYSDAQKHAIVYATLLALFFLAAIGTTACLIFPLMYYVWYESKHGNFPAGVEVVGAGHVHVSNILPTKEFKADIPDDSIKDSIPDGSISNNPRFDETNEAIRVTGNEL